MLKVKRGQAGFTLVEIAIVLVVVGLLLGGVLKGQSLIQGAKVSNTVKQMQGLQTMVFTFQDRFGGLPGDMSNASTVIGNGAVDCTWQCNNGRIQPYRNASLAFNQLKAAGIYSGNAPSAEVNAAPDVTNAPANAWGGAFMIANWNRYANVGGAAPSRDGIWTGRNVPSSVLAEIDRKIDDGSPMTGDFRAGWPYQNSAACLDTTNNVWKTDGTTCAGVMFF